MTKLKGIPVSPGLAVGVAVLIETPDTAESGRTISMEEIASEMSRFDAAVEVASRELLELRDRLEAKVGKDEAAIFEAQSMMVQDPALRDSVQAHLRGGLTCAEKAVGLACEEQARILEGVEDPYFAARASDLRDIGRRLSRILTGASARGAVKGIPDGAVVVATDLAPSDTASLDVNKVAAIVLDKGGRTSHTAILARSLGIPAVVATGEATSAVRDGDLVAVDGETGEVSVNPAQVELSSLRERAKAFAEEKARLAKLKDLPAITLDGKRVELVANIGNLADAETAIRAGAEGVGLFRTEFLFIDRDTMPDEDEQYEAYRKVLSIFAPRPVVVRTLDIGGDKDVPYLGLQREQNPFLGLRAIRLCLDRKDMFRTQLRALLRASVHGNLRVMFPMISCLEELREAKAELQKTKEELCAAGVPVAHSIEVGIMVEVPAAAVDADILSPECDFFSIGTNDLVQYTTACDRGNPKVAYLSDPFTPAVLRLVSRTIEEGHKRGIWVGMCGEMAGMPEAIPLLLAMGLDELSMSPGAVPRAKEIVRKQNADSLGQVWDRVKKMRTAQEIRQYLQTL